VKEPCPIVAPGYEVRRSQPLQRARHRRALRTHQVGEELVSKPDRQDDLPLFPLSPAVGQVPKQHEQPRADAPKPRERKLEHGCVRALQTTGYYLLGHPGPACDRLDELSIEDRDSRGGDDAPRTAERHRRPRVSASPGSQHVAMANELDATPPEQLETSREHSIEHKKCEQLTAVALLNRRRPRPARQLD
jgi:hypothetical protein